LTGNGNRSPVNSGR